jgi:hypothetical protein
VRKWIEFVNKLPSGAVGLYGQRITGISDSRDLSDRKVGAFIDFLNGLDRGNNRGVAVLSAADSGMWEEVLVPRPLSDRAVISDHPYVLPLEAMVETYEYVSPPAFHWLAVQIEKAGRNRFGIGARVTIEAGGRRQVREIRSGGSYLSQNDLRAYYGLGSYSGLVDVEVKMPGGRIWRWRACRRRSGSTGPGGQPSASTPTPRLPST